MNPDTIFAPASGSGRAAVAVIRVSGPKAADCLDRMVGRRPPPRMASLARLKDPEHGTVLDQALVLWFPAPASFTGENCVELQLHGGRAVVASVLAGLGRLPGYRLAEPGEFTRRALQHGKMDLAEVEGLADLIDAQTEAQRRQALRQMEGALRHWVAARREELLAALAAAESAIDFSDEADVAGDFEAEVYRIACALDTAIGLELGRSAVAVRVREGLVVTLAGPPNAGKSTLLNALARRDVAIVSPLAGTTRDPVEVQLDLDGSLVTVIDTAGLRETSDPIEREGIARTHARARSADLVLWLCDARNPVPPEAGLQARMLWRVATHVDLTAGSVDADFAVAPPIGAGMTELVEALRAMAGEGQAGGEAGLLTRLRHRQALEHARSALLPLLAGPHRNMELAAEQIRVVAGHLDTLTGPIAVEEVLGEIFARFCVGK